MDCNIHFNVVFFVAIVATLVASEETGCLGHHVKGSIYGYTYPKGDITIQHGKPLQIFCVLQSSSNYTSSSLIFTKNNQVIPSKYISIVNSTAIRLKIENPEPDGDGLYVCLVKTEKFNIAVCLNKVAIGFAPRPVSNFSCVSYNWDNLNCSWVPPNNFVKTDYIITYSVGNDAEMFCPNDTETEKTGCIWNKSTIPLYRQAHENVRLTLRANNTFGNATWKFKINQYAVVIPNKPENLTFSNVTKDSLQIAWVAPKGLEIFPPGLVYDVTYKREDHEWEKGDTSSLCISKCSSKWFILTLTGLRSYTLYDVRVRSRSFKGSDPYLWSDNATITLRTKPSVPSIPPKTDIGSFESKQYNLSQRDIFIYWQEIPKIDQNGDSFEYKIVKMEENGWQVNVATSEITKWFAKFKGMLNETYKFYIASSNSEGLSERFSEVVVPSFLNLPSEPESVTKIPYDNGTYELSWRPPRNHSSIESYTIFWCESKTDRLLCTGVLNWTRVDKDVNTKNISVPNPEVSYRFAVSANTEFISSGLVWASCTILRDRAGGRMRTISKDKIGATFITINWKLDCSDQIGLVTGYKIYYCPTPKGQISCSDEFCSELLECGTPYKEKIINESHTSNHANITDLRPYSTYKLYIEITTKNWSGLKSDPVFFTTSETSPGRMREVEVVKLTNTSVTVSWVPPSQMNGILKYYVLRWNDQEQVQVEGITSYTLKGLMSYKSYSISVSACTVLCSEPSPSVSALTLAGEPNKILKPVVGIISPFELKVSWLRPTQPAGDISHYDILVLLMDDSKIIKEDVYHNVTGLSWKIKTDCSSEGAYLYKIAVRAVNRAQDGSFMVGPWSDFETGNCFNVYPKMSLGAILSLSTVGVLCLIAFCLFCGWFVRWAWLSCKVMRDIGVKLPARLDTARTDLDKLENHSMHIRGNQSKDFERTTPSPDEQHLLEKKEKEEPEFYYHLTERDSSGCGSGQESVSSVNSGTHISADSGTEADTSSAPPQGVTADQGHPPYVRVPPTFVATPHVGGYVTLPPGFSNQVAMGYVKAAAPPSPNSPDSPVTSPYCKLGLKHPDVNKPFQGFGGDQAHDGVVSPVNSN